jgi:hypothetical protein
MASSTLLNHFAFIRYLRNLNAQLVNMIGAGTQKIATALRHRPPSWF